jgi:hypothetical protein
MTGQSVVQTDGMARVKPATRVCGACNETLLSGYNPGTVCASCERALFAARELSDPGLAGWVWDTEAMRRALARLDFPAVLVMYRSAARLSRRELGALIGVSHSVIWYWEVGRRQGIYDMAAYRQRLAGLDEELAEAERWNDAERASRLRAEKDFLVRELAAATGLGGRPQQLGADSERARLNVTRAIRTAISRIRDRAPDAAAHLDQAVRTGTRCSYFPPDRP